MPALLSCATATGPKRSTMSPGSPSASAWTARHQGARPSRCLSPSAARQPRREPLRIDLPFRVRVEAADRCERPGVEHRRAQRLTVGASSRTSVPGGSARASADIAISLA